LPASRNSRMTVVTKLEAYEDERHNKIIYSGKRIAKVRITFIGSGNTLVVANPTRLATLVVDFDCDNGRLEIGASKGVPPFRTAIKIGQDSTVKIGANVSSTSRVRMSATEGTTINIGDDVMFSTGNQVRADDGHPIFDVESGRRVNVSTSITIGAHVWLGRTAAVLAGGRIGDGSVIGYGAVVTRPIPNNCIAVGVPARVIKRNIAWERPHLSRVEPYYKPDASTITKSSQYWRLTETPTPSPPAVRKTLRILALRIRRTRSA
jgi:acetyltransferase-like isoleucine patch superfamily enzyme